MSEKGWKKAKKKDESNRTTKIESIDSKKKNIFLLFYCFYLNLTT